MPVVEHIPEKVQTKTAMGKCIEYCIQEKKTVDDKGNRYVTGINCYGLNAYNEFMTTKYAYGQDKGRFFYQYLQSFNPKDDIDYDTAHRIGIEFASKAWQGHEVLVATHCDREHIHNHFIINSVNFENGKKLRQSPNTLVTLRALSDEICKGYGIKVLKPYDKTIPKGMSNGELKVAQKGQSWKMKLAGDIDYAMHISGSKDEFIDSMKQLGYQVTWTNERKYITYTCPSGMKCRDNKLHEEKYRKENMEYEFEIRYAEKAKQRNVQQDEFGNQQYSRRQRAMGVTHSSAEEQWYSDRQYEHSNDRQSRQADGERPICTGWESERQDYFTRQIGQRENENLSAENDTGADSASNNRNIGINHLDLPSGDIIETESDDYDLRERQRRARQNLNAVVYAMDELANLIEESKKSYDDDNEDEDEDIGFEQSM